MTRCSTLASGGAICAWPAANDVDARLVPVDARLTIDGDRLTVQLHALNGNGRRYVVADAVVRHTVDVAPREPLPEPPFRSLAEVAEGKLRRAAA